MYLSVRPNVYLSELLTPYLPHHIRAIRAQVGSVLLAVAMAMVMVRVVMVVVVVKAWARA